MLWMTDDGSQAGTRREDDMLVDLQEALLASDYEVVRITGYRQSLRLARRQAAWSIRWRSKGKSARPYIMRLMSLSLLMCPST